MKKKAILITTSTFPRWPADNTSPFVFNLAQDLSEHFHVIVLAPHFPKSLKYERIKDIDVYRFQYLFENLETLAYDGGILSKLKSNPLNYLSIPFFIIFQLSMIIHLVRKYSIETIYAHWIIPQGLIAALYRKIFNKKIKIVCTSHGSDLLGLKGGVSRRLTAFTLRNINKLTVVSQSLKEAAKQYKTLEEIEVISLGYNPNYFNLSAPTKDIRSQYNIEGPFFVYVGRLSEEKGLVYLLQALNLIKENIHNFKLLIIGNGPLEQSLKNKSEELNLSENIIWLNNVPHQDLADYFKNADILIGPSLREGLGLVFIEAIACGCCVIASNLKTISEVVIDGKTGFTAEAGNPQSIADKIMYVLKHKQYAKEMALQGSKYMFEKYDSSKAIKKLTEIL